MWYLYRKHKISKKSHQKFVWTSFPEIGPAHASNPRTARSEDRPVRLGPRFSKFFWSWSGPKFLKNFWSWSGLVLGPDGTAWSWTSRFGSVDPWLMQHKIQRFQWKCFFSLEVRCRIWSVLTLEWYMVIYIQKIKIWKSFSKLSVHDQWQVTIKALCPGS